METKKQSQKEPVKLREKKLANGNVSLYLDIYRNGKRQKEYLKLYLIDATTPAQKEQNRQTLATAQAIKAKRQIELQNGEYYMFDSVESIGKETFSGCKGLKEIHWSKNAKTIQKNVLNGCKSLKKIVIPEGVAAIEEAAFCDCKSLESISLPSTIVSIAKGGTFGFNPFQLCGSLKEIVVPVGTKAKFQQLLNGFSGNPANLLVERNI